MKKDILLSLDVASTEFYKEHYYYLKGEKQKLSSDQMINYLKDLVSAYPIYSIEDISLADISDSKEKLNILSTLSPTSRQEIRMKRSNNKHNDDVWGDRINFLAVNFQWLKSTKIETYLNDYT